LAFTFFRYTGVKPVSDMIHPALTFNKSTISIQLSKKQLSIPKRKKRKKRAAWLRLLFFQCQNIDFIFIFATVGGVFQWNHHKRM